MATITIIDTGYPNVDKSGNKEGSSDMANGGSAITLKAVSLDYGRGANIADNPIPAKYADMELNFSSVENPKMVVTGILDRKNVEDIDWDDDNTLYHLDKLVRTKGIKLLYYSTTGDSYTTLIEALGFDNYQDGHTDSGNELSMDTPHLHIRILSLKVRQASSGSAVRFTLECEVTA